MSGTLAEIKNLEWLTIWDLLHGMRLPSGNDAALFLAKYLGALLHFKRNGELD